MNTLKWTLLIATAALLVYMAVDRWREPQQLQRVSQSLDRLETALQDLARSQKQLAETMARLQNVEQGVRPAAVITNGTTKPTTVVIVDPKIRDGNPKLDVNFLMPYDRSRFHAEKQGGTLKVFEETPRRLNPLIDSSAITERLETVTTDSLCDRPATHPEQWSESLATSVIISDDYKIYTFTLRRGVKWHRPVLAQQKEYSWLAKEVELTAEDFRFAVDLILDQAVDCPSKRNYYEDIDKAEVIDDYTLRLVWKKKTYNSLAASMALSPLPRHIYGRNSDGSTVPADKLGVNFNQHWFDELHAVAGVGAYILEEYVPDKILRLRRNPDYWGVMGHFDAIEWNMEIKKDDAQLIAFKNGMVNYYGLAPNFYKSEILDHHEPRFAALDVKNPKAGRAGELGWERIKRLSFSYLGWNMRRDYFSDKRVRKAMSYALPKDRIIKDVFFGLGVPVLSDVAPGTQYENTELKSYTFDLEKAKALLAEAGWKDSDGDGILDRTTNGVKHDFRFTMKYGANISTLENMMLIYKDELRKIGIDMVPKPFEWKEMMRVFEDKDFDAVLGSWQMDWDIDYFQLWHSSQSEVQGGSNHCGFVNQRVDELALKLRETFDVSARIAIAKELQAIIHEEQPYTFFTSPENILIWQNRGSPKKDFYLDGVDQSLDQLHPLTRTVDRRMFWNFRQ